MSERWDKCPEAYAAFCEAMRRWQRAWNALLELRGVDRVVAELERMFGPAPVKKAVEAQIKALEDSRRQGRLGVDRTGLVTTTVSAVHVPVARNTFYGG